MRKFSALFAACGCVALLPAINPGNASAQQATKPLMLVTWFGPGAIALPHGEDWKPELLTVYDNGRRPVAQFSKEGGALTASFILFENLSGEPSARGCRRDAINPIIDHDAKIISNPLAGEEKGEDGEPLATTSYFISMGGSARQHNLFGFEGNAKVCAELHLSAVNETKAQGEAMQAIVAHFHPDLNYQPLASDYFRLASLLFKDAPQLAAPYYKASLDAMPGGADFTTPRRMATDQLVMSLGMSGDLKGSNAVAEKAVAADPDYPINYYNLACADAESGDAAGAKAHLQQAFDRRANVLKGESMPDPTKDDSILKLKKNKEFWAFVVGLPKN
jgi:tetratricopeptide (TPR) repeat protein